MNKEEIIDQIIESLTEIKTDKNIEITNFSSKPVQVANYNLFINYILNKINEFKEKMILCNKN